MFYRILAETYINMERSDFITALHIFNSIYSPIGFRRHKK